MNQQVETVLWLRRHHARCVNHGGKWVRIGGRKFPAKHLRAAIKLEQAAREEAKNYGREGVLMTALAGVRSLVNRIGRAVIRGKRGRA